MKFIVVLALLFVGCVAAATNSSSSTGESTGVSSESSHAFNTSSSSAHAFNVSSSTGEASTGLSSSSSEHNATFSSSGEHNSSTSSTGQASSSTGAASSTGSIPTPTPEPCYSSFTYGNTTKIGSDMDSSAGFLAINNNSYISYDGYITSISLVYTVSSPNSTVVLKRVRPFANNTYTNGNTVHYEYVGQVNITGLISNSTELQTVNVTLAVKKGELLGLYSATGSFGATALTDGYAWCGGNISSSDIGCYWNTQKQVRLEFTLQVEVPCDSSSSSTGAGPNTTSSSTGALSSSSSPSNTTSAPTLPPTLPPTSSSSTGAAPTEAPQPQPQEASTSKSITATGFVVGAASMLGVVLLVAGVCWHMKRNQNTSSMNSPLLSHA